MFAARQLGRLAVQNNTTPSLICTQIRTKKDLRVFLLEDVDRVGVVSQEVAVTPGYARNYLIPYNKAMYAIERNKPIVEHLTGKPIIPLALAEATAASTESAQQYAFKTLAYSLQQVDLQFLRYPVIEASTSSSKTPVTKRDIAKRFNDAGFFHISEDDIHLGDFHSLTRMGAYPISVFLQSPDHNAWVNLFVTVRRMDDVYINSVTGSNKSSQAEFVDAVSITKKLRRRAERASAIGSAISAD